MGIFDDDLTLDDDPFNPKKQEEPFKMDFSLSQYADDLTKSLGASAGGHGGSLPVAFPETSTQIEAKPYQPATVSPLKNTGSALLPAAEPNPAATSIKPVKADPILPAASARATKTKSANPSMADKTINIVNRMAQPDLQNAENIATLGGRVQKEIRVNPEQMAEGINRIAKTDLDESRDTGTLGVRLKKEVEINPEALRGAINRSADADREEARQTGTLAKRVQKEGTFSHEQLSGVLNQIAKADLAESETISTLGQRVGKEAIVDTEQMAEDINQHYETGLDHKSKVAESDLFLARAKSLKNRQGMMETFSSLFNQTSPADYTDASNNAQLYTRWSDARFDPSVINGYSALDRRFAQNKVNAAISLGKDFKYDPEEAKKQAYPILDRVNHYYGAPSRDGNTLFHGGSFSAEKLTEQVRDHMLKGTAISYKQMEDTTRLVASMEDTEYGNRVRNFMGSLYSGSLTVGQEATQTFFMATSSMPPPEIAMFQYQQMYIANANDPAGWAQEIEDMATFNWHMGDSVYGFFDEGKQMLRGLRTDDYNELEYFSHDPLQSALRRPDRLTGDLFEKVIPGIISFCIPGKVGTMLQSQKGAKLMVQFGWVAKRSFNMAGTEKLMQLQRNPELVDNNPAYHRYMQNSAYAQANPEKARQYFIEGEARRTGLQSALIGIGTAAGSNVLLGATRTGAEGPVLKWFQEFVLGQISEAGSEAVNANHTQFIKEAEKGGREKEKPNF